MDERKKLDPVVKNEVTISEKKRFKDSIIAKDARTVGKYAIFDVTIPAIKRFIYDLSTKVLGYGLFGDSSTSSGYSNNYNRPYQMIQYGNTLNNYQNRSQQPSQNQTQDPVNGLEYNRFVFKTRGDCEAVLTQMSDIIESYGVVRITDLYEIVGKTAPFTAENYGWKAIGAAKITVVSDGFNIQFPPAICIK